MKSPDDDRKLVYSSDPGWKPDPALIRRPVARGSLHVPDDGVVRVSREKRRGGIVSLVTGLSAIECDAVAKALKRHCGTGGTAKSEVVEIQGDHRDKIVAWFAAQGRKVKRAGG